MTDSDKAAGGFLAAGHPVGPSPVPGGRTQHMDLQTTTPVPGVVIHAMPGGDVNSAPLMQSLASHPVPVAVMNQALASNPGLPGLFGANMPRGVGDQPDVHTAPTGADSAGFRVNAQRPGGPPAMDLSDHRPGQIQRPSTWNMPDDAA